MGKLFNFLAPVARPFLKVRNALWAEPVGEEPCIFLANHLGAVGPMYMSIAFPLRDKVAIWCNEGMMDEKLIVDYVRHDWWWSPESKLAPFYSATIPYIARLIVPKILRSAPTIAVCRDARVMTTMRKSLKALKEGKHLVIFPELPDGHDSHAEHLQMGWLNLVSMYHKATGKVIRMIPVYIDEEAGLFRVEKAITADPDIPVKEQAERIERYLAACIRGQLE
jgi:1-acyl-sn-glycerol-3-phosphate acyltransferase